MMSAGFRRSFEFFLTVTLLAALSVTPALAQRGGASDAATPLPSIADKTSGMQRMDGFLPLYWDADLGQLWMEIPQLDQEMIHLQGFGAGLGSNDLGLDRGGLRGSQIVKFERVGRKVLMVQPNYRFRANSDNPDEVRAVRDAFARSVLWGFTPEAETSGRILVDMTDFLLRDAIGAGPRMQPGTYRLDNSRSTIYMEMTHAFPTNTEMEVELTFVQPIVAQQAVRGPEPHDPVRGGGTTNGTARVRSDPDLREGRGDGDTRAT